MEATLNQELNAREVLNNTNKVFGKRIGLITALFGCRHKELSRPFTDTDTKDSYRACLSCGARKKFDTKTMKTSGPFYHPPKVTFDNT